MNRSERVLIAAIELHIAGDANSNQIDAATIESSFQQTSFEVCVNSAYFVWPSCCSHTHNLEGTMLSIQHCATGAWDKATSAGQQSEREDGANKEEDKSESSNRNL